jgi:hypothetical protein
MYTAHISPRKDIYFRDADRKLFFYHSGLGAPTNYIGYNGAEFRLGDSSSTHQTNIYGSGVRVGTSMSICPTPFNPDYMLHVRGGDGMLERTTGTDTDWNIKNTANTWTWRNVSDGKLRLFRGTQEVISVSETVNIKTLSISAAGSNFNPGNSDHDVYGYGSSAYAVNKRRWGWDSGGDFAFFGNHTDGNYSKFEGDGTLVFFGNATTWRDENASALGLPPGAAAPDRIEWASSGTFVKAFDGVATTESLEWTTEIPHDYKEGTDLVVHVHWAPTTTDAGSVVWQCRHLATSPAGAVTSSTLLTGTAAAAGGTAWVEKRTDIGSISGSGLTIGRQINFTFFRDPTATGDDYGADACVLTVGFHYEVDTPGGSRQITTK